MGAYVDQVDAFKRELLERTLREHAGNRARTADALGIARSYFFKLIKDRGIDVPHTDTPTRYSERRCTACRKKGHTIARHFPRSGA